MRYVSLLALILLVSIHFVASKQVRHVTGQVKDFRFLVAFGDIVDWKLRIARTFASLTTRNPQEFYGDDHFCSGVVISRRHIVTAAVCVMEVDKIQRRERNLIVVTGWSKRLLFNSEMVSRLRCESVHVHPEFIRKNRHNIAVLRVERSFATAEYAVVVAPLPTKPPPYETECMVMGWGRRYKRGPLAGELKSAPLVIKEGKICEKLSSDFMAVDEICAVDPIYKARTPCEGDMGAPLFCGGVLYGITSATDKCQVVDPVSRFIDIYEHMDWITGVLSAAEKAKIHKSIIFLFFAIIIRSFEMF